MSLSTTGSPVTYSVSSTSVPQCSLALGTYPPSASKNKTPRELQTQPSSLHVRRVYTDNKTHDGTGQGPAAAPGTQLNTLILNTLRLSDIPWRWNWDSRWRPNQLSNKSNTCWHRAARVGQVNGARPGSRGRAVCCRRVASHSTSAGGGGVATGEPMECASSSAAVLGRLRGGEYHRPGGE